MAASDGPAVDSHQEPVFDPSKNVLDLVEAGLSSEADLRNAQIAHLREIVQLNAQHARELREAETARINAIRDVDVGAVNRAAEVAATQASVLAAQLVANGEAGRLALAQASTAWTTTLAQALEPMQRDIRDLRDAQAKFVGGKDQTGEGRDKLAAIVGVIGLMLALVVYFFNR